MDAPAAIHLDADGVGGAKAELASPPAARAPSQRLVFAAFVMLGLMCLLPWNCFLSATDFFVNTAVPNRDWPTYSTQVYQTIFMVVQLLMIPCGQKLSTFARFHAPLGVCCVFAVVLMIVACRVEDLNGRFVACLAVAAVLGSAMGVLQSAVFAAAAQGIEQYGNLPAAIMMGMGFAGALTFALALVASTASGSDTVAFVVLFVVVVVFSCLSFLLGPLFKRLTNRSAREACGAAEGLEVQLQRVAADEHLEVWGTYRSVLAGLTFELAVFCVFATTFMVFPAACVQWNVRALGPVPGSWYVTLVLGDFQLMDNVGRVLADLPQWKALDHPKILWVLVVLRMVFVPLFVLCANGGHWIFRSQVFQLAVMAAFACSNGLLGSLVIQFAPRHVPAAARGTLGMAMTLFLVGGIAAGSYLAMLLDPLIH